jgi:hypothetical protein
MSDLPIVSAETNTLNEAIIVRGTTKEKKCILDAHEEHFGQDFDYSMFPKRKVRLS